MVKTKFIRFSIPVLLFFPFIQSFLLCPYPIPWMLCEECFVFSCFMNPKTTHLRKFLLINFLVSGMVVGRNFCSWVCPYGALQEIPSILGRRRGFSPLKRGIRAVKVFLVSLTFLFAFALYPTMPKAPFYITDYLYVAAVTLTSFILSVPWLTTFIRLFLFAFFLALTLLWRRAWCKICPLGTLLSPFNKVSLFKLRIDRPICDNCSLCSSICQMDLKPEVGGLESVECIKCLDCAQECKTSAIRVELRKFRA